MEDIILICIALSSATWHQEGDNPTARTVWVDWRARGKREETLDRGRQINTPGRYLDVSWCPLMEGKGARQLDEQRRGIELAKNTGFDNFTWLPLRGSRASPMPDKTAMLRLLRRGREAQRSNANIHQR